jgi:hypothetical protein
MVQVSADGSATTDFLASYKPGDAAELNELMSACIPEVRDSQFGDYPMKQHSWMLLNTGIGENPAFIASHLQVKYREDANYNEKVPMKRDYVFGTGPKGFGYYHLLTRQAWVLLNSRIVVAKSSKSSYKSWTKGRSDQFMSAQDKSVMDKLGKFLYRRSHEAHGPNEVEQTTFFGAKQDISGEMC